MSTVTDPLLARIVALAEGEASLIALWLYGSRARGDHHAASDYDLAVAFSDWPHEALERRLRPELLALDWQAALGLPEQALSVVDLAIAPIPLGWSILCDGQLLLDRSPQQRMTHESRIMSLWEIDYAPRATRNG